MFWFPACAVIVAAESCFCCTDAKVVTAARLLGDGPPAEMELKGSKSDTTSSLTTPNPVKVEGLPIDLDKAACRSIQSSPCCTVAAKWDPPMPPAGGPAL